MNTPKWIIFLLAAFLAGYYAHQPDQQAMARLREEYTYLAQEFGELQRQADRLEERSTVLQQTAVCGEVR